MRRVIRYGLPFLTFLTVISGGYYYNFICAGCPGALAQPKPSSNCAVNDFRAKNQNFFKAKGLRYLKNLEVLSPKVREMDVRLTERYLKNPKHFDQLERKYGRLVAQGYMAPLSIRFINDQIGYGVFAECDIAEGEMVGEYTGQVIDLKDVKSTKYNWVYSMTHDKLGNPVSISLDASETGNEMRYVNHDYNPNAGMQTVPQGGFWHAVYIANRPIKKGEQVLTNYGTGYWSGARGQPHQFVDANGAQKPM